MGLPIRPLGNSSDDSFEEALPQFSEDDAGGLPSISEGFSPVEDKEIPVSSVQEPEEDIDFDSLFDDEPDSDAETIQQLDGKENITDEVDPDTELEKDIDFDSLFDDNNQRGQEETEIQEQEVPDEEWDKIINDEDIEDENNKEVDTFEDDENFSEDEDENEDKDDEDDGKENKKEQKPKNQKNKLSSVKRILSTPYRFLKFLFSLPMKILRFLSSIPLIGRLFRPFVKGGILGFILRLFIPVAIIVAIIFFISSKSVPGEETITGPDESQATISDFSLDNQTAKAKITNQGDTIAYVTATFTVWTYKPFSGGNIFSYNKISSCTSERVTIDIDSSKEVTSQCDVSGKGMFTKVSGTISY